MARLLAAGVVLVVLLAAVLSLPARLLPRVTGGEDLRLSGLSGTLMNGSAARAMLRTPVGFLHLGSVRWSLQPLSLLRLAPRLELESAWGRQRAALSATWRGGRLVLRDVEANLDASLVRALAPLAVDGRLTLLMDALVLDDGALRAADGRVVWRDAVWQTQDGGRPLGSYAATLVTGAPGSVAAQVETLAGPVFAAGSAALDAQRYRIDLRIDGGGRALDADVERALQLFATPREDGYLLRLEGELAASR